MSDVRDRFTDEADSDLRRLGLYVDHAEPTVVDGPQGETEVLLVTCSIGDVAFTDRVQEPERDAEADAFAEIEQALLQDGFLDAHQQMLKNLREGRDALDNGDDD